jgi:hypothetical protein
MGNGSAARRLLAQGAGCHFPWNRMILAQCSYAFLLTVEAEVLGANPYHDHARP